MTLVIVGDHFKTKEMVLQASGRSSINNLSQSHDHGSTSNTHKTKIDTFLDIENKRNAKRGRNLKMKNHLYKVFSEKSMCSLSLSTQTLTSQVANRYHQHMYWQIREVPQMFKISAYKNKLDNICTNSYNHD